MADELQAPGNKGTIHRESELNVTRCEDGATRTKAQQPSDPMCEFETILTEGTVAQGACPDISSIPWYHPRLSRHVAESLLFGSPVGTYLIRDSASTSDCLTLSVRCKNSVKHYRVTWDGQQFVFGLCKFANVAEFQEHFRNQPMISGESGALVLLNSPYPRCVSEPDTYIDAMYFEESTVSTPAINPSQFAINSKEGYLIKLGLHRKNWKKRWFVLFKNELRYYENEESNSPLRVINLFEASTVEKDPTKEFCFRLVTHHRTFYMCAQSAEEMDQWMEKLSWKLQNLTASASASPNRAAKT